MTATLPAPCDRANAAATHGGKAPHQQWTLVATILASSLAFIDGSVVNVALPAIGHGYGATAADLQWTINAYLLPLSALLLIGGAAGDHFGRRRLLIGGIAIFTLSSHLFASFASEAHRLSSAVQAQVLSGRRKARCIAFFPGVGAAQRLFEGKDAAFDFLGCEGVAAEGQPLRCIVTPPDHPAILLSSITSLHATRR
jgi:MFS family permease